MRTTDSRAPLIIQHVLYCASSLEGRANRANRARPAGRGSGVSRCWSGAWGGDAGARADQGQGAGRIPAARVRRTVRPVESRSDGNNRLFFTPTWGTRKITSPPIRSLLQSLQGTHLGRGRGGSPGRSLSQLASVARQTRKHLGAVRLVGRAARAWCRDGGETTGFLPPHSN